VLVIAGTDKITSVKTQILEFSRKGQKQKLGLLFVGKKLIRLHHNMKQFLRFLHIFLIFVCTNLNNKLHNYYIERFDDVNMF
jgi:hypothetical protein